MVFLGSGKISISVRSNLVFKGLVDRSFAKRSKRQALKRARRVIEGYGPWIPLVNVKNLMVPPNAKVSRSAPLLAQVGSTDGLEGGD